MVIRKALQIIGLIIPLTLPLGVSAQEAASAGQFADSTITALGERVSSLREQIQKSNKLVKVNRLKIQDQAFLIKNAGKITDEMINNFKILAEEFKKGGNYHQALVSAQADLGKLIEQYDNSTSDVQRSVAQQLKVSRDRFEKLSERRDAALHQALREIRRLEANKEDIKALMIVNAYQRLGNYLDETLTSFEAAIKTAGEVNDDVAKAANLPTE